ncbi:MAG TPA: FAD-dependent oxidoreductase [Tepidisphaeraceae bacterium]|nr:FAD-dependent oxidoreductase [Tepidisphaeraceae bacterium]
MIHKVIVLGGGSAGFLAALALKVKLSTLQVVVIRSREIGIIGVGEGSTGILTDFLHNYLNVGWKKFYEAAAPTWKLGLKFIWGPRPYFNYTFGPGLEIRSDPAQAKPNGYYCDDNIEYPDQISAMMTHDRVFAEKNGMPIAHGHVAYHFENERFVRYLEGAALAKRVEILDDTVTQTQQDDHGITSLILKSGTIAQADLYVDCSGFASALLGKAFGEPFISFKKSLFCDRAIVGGRDRQGAEDEVIKPYTTCETMDSGWAWQIEHEHRVARGYVYSSDFISDDNAEREFRTKNPKIGPTRVVRFISGRYERSWVKNVVAIGNASGFVEPLEATALGAIAKQSRLLAETLASSDCQPGPMHADMYNRFNGQWWDSILRFLAVHYKFNTRLDTPFWRHCREHTDLAGAQEIVEYYKENGPDGSWGATLLQNPNDQFTNSGYITMLTGMKVPYRRTWAPTQSDNALFEQRRMQFRDMALKAMPVRKVLGAIRSPEWSWA